MANNVVFNASVCIIGILILLIHVVNILFKKDRRKDEKVLLEFFMFTLVKTFYYTSNAYIIVFYTAFYIMNNLEVYMLFRYARNYIVIDRKRKKIISIINLCLISVFIALDIINSFTGIFFTAQNGEYLRSPTMIISQGYQFVTFAIIFVIAVMNKKLNVREKSAFCLYCCLPFVAIILQNLFKGYAIGYLSIIISIEVLFLFLSVQKNIDLAKEEEKNKAAQIKLMLSQIKPHFVYNSLSAISTLITIEPEKAQAALDDFTEYLRMNISSLTELRCIPFDDELKHIKTYVALEKMRFAQRINVVYDIQTTDFLVPPLTIQPIVENAIKHGILKKIEGGTMTLKTWETKTAYIIEISDDGVGFNLNDVNFEQNKHFGLQNIQYRLAKMCDAELKVHSEINKGTRVTVTFLKENLSENTTC